MFIASVELEIENKQKYKYKIVTDESEEDYDSEIALIHYKSNIADKIIEAFTNEKDYFYLDDREFRIVSIVTNALFDRYNVHKHRRIDFSNKAVPIRIYKKTAVCPKCRRNGNDKKLENVIATVSCLLNRYDTCDIEIQHCHNCKTFFIDEQSLALYERRHGILLFERVKISDKKRYNNGYYNDNTILSRYGYSAQISEKVRRTVLVYLIENGYKNDVKSILSGFIRYRGERCYKACPVWKADLEFVNNYNLKNDRYIGCGKVYYG